MIELDNEPFVRGNNWIVHDNDMDFGVLKLRGGDVYESSPNVETIFLLLSGEVTFFYHVTETITCQRENKFKDKPSIIHFSGNQSVILRADKHCELICVHKKNNNTFDTRFDFEKTDGMQLQLSEHILKEPASIQANRKQIIHAQPKCELSAELNLKRFHADYPCTFKLAEGDQFQLNSTEPVYLLELLY